MSGLGGEGNLGTFEEELSEQLGLAQCTRTGNTGASRGKSLTSYSSLAMAAVGNYERNEVGESRETAMCWWLVQG